VARDSYLTPYLKRGTMITFTVLIFLTKNSYMASSMGFLPDLVHEESNNDDIDSAHHADKELIDMASSMGCLLTPYIRSETQ